MARPDEVVGKKLTSVLCRSPIESAALYRLTRAWFLRTWNSPSSVNSVFPCSFQGALNRQRFLALFLSFLKLYLTQVAPQLWRLHRQATRLASLSNTSSSSLGSFTRSAMLANTLSQRLYVLASCSLQLYPSLANVLCDGLVTFTSEKTESIYLTTLSAYPSFPSLATSSRSVGRWRLASSQSSPWRWSAPRSLVSTQAKYPETFPKTDFLLTLTYLSKKSAISLWKNLAELTGSRTVCCTLPIYCRNSLIRFSASRPLAARYAVIFMFTSFVRSFGLIVNQMLGRPCRRDNALICLRMYKRCSFDMC